MPTLVPLASPNGAGKTTFTNRFLRRRAEAFRFVNPPFLPFSRREKVGPKGSDEGLACPSA
jgi:predicted ABC-type ATPase